MNIAHLFKDTVTVAHLSSVSEAGDPTFATATTFKARVEHGSKLITDSSGNSMTAEHWFVSATVVGQEDRVWLPGDNTGSTDAARRPIMVKKATELLGGNTLYEVYL